MPDLEQPTWSIAVIIGLIALLIVFFTVVVPMLAGPAVEKLFRKLESSLFPTSALALPLVFPLWKGSGKKKVRRAKTARFGQIDSEAVMMVVMIIGIAFAVIALVYLGFVQNGFAKAGALLKDKFERTGGFV